MNGRVVIALISFVLAGCIEDFDPTEPERPPSVPADTVWRGSQKGGIWGKCLSTSDTQISCEFFSGYGHKTVVVYELCQVRAFKAADYKSPLGTSPAWVENDGMGWIDSSMIQFVPYGEVGVYDWSELEASKNQTCALKWTISMYAAYFQLLSIRRMFE